MSLPLPEATSCVFTFHREGLFTQDFTMHQPAVTGQIRVLAAVGSGTGRR